MRTFCITTLGCKVNQYESEQVAALLVGRGLTRVHRPEDADLRVVNTCSVTLQAASKSRQLVRQSTRGAQRTIVVGCWATSDRAEAAGLDGVSAVIGHSDDLAAELSKVLERWGVQDGRPTIAAPPARQPGHQRAFLKIQDGCDAHCTYCIIPSLRKRLWSRPIDDCIEEARRLVDAGHVELVLTGIFLGAFGRDTARRSAGCSSDECCAKAHPTGHRTALASLLDALCTRVPGLKRLRLSSLEPGDLDDDLIAVLRSHPQLVPHFHLPLQSGSDGILRRMNRQYRRGHYLRMIQRINDAFDRPAITTDIIVGFPGESDTDFAQTLDVVDRARFIHIHGFPFSPRPGTAAARWTSQFVRGPIINERIASLTERANRYSLDFRQQFIGEVVEILVERPSCDEQLPQQHGRCERYFQVYFRAPTLLTGQSAKLRIGRVDGEKTFGELEQP